MERAARPERQPVAWTLLGIASAAFVLLELAVSGRYGYHRDELYFIAIGGHPAFGYPDQPPLVPLLAHAVDAVSGHSLVALRVLPALAGGCVVLVTGLIAREFGGGRVEQLIAAAAMGASGVLLGTSHLMSTTTFDLLAWTVLLWLAVRALRDDGRTWLLVGVTAGLDLEIKTLPLFLLFGLVVGVAATDARQVFRSRWLWSATAVALAVWAPNFVWQATNGWPQIELATSIAAGESGSSEPRWLFLPLQLLQMGPLLVPVWLAGLWRLYRDPALARWRCLSVAYATLVAVFVATGGKPYYLAGMYPALFAAGAPATVRWLRARARARRALLIGALALSAATSALVALPIIPARDLPDSPIPAFNYDAGEQVGWPAFARTVATAWQASPAPARTVVLTGNYGEAGALLRYAPWIDAVYSGHNALWDYGPPPGSADTAIVVGYPLWELRLWFDTVTIVARIDNGLGLDNDEQGEPVWRCTDPRGGWFRLWPQVRHLG